MVDLVEEYDTEVYKLSILNDKPISQIAEASMVYFVLIALGCVVSYVVKPLFTKCPTFSTPLSVLWFLIGLITSAVVLGRVEHTSFGEAFTTYAINVKAEVVYLILLPPLLYEGAMCTDAMKFRLLFWVSIFLATVGVVFTAVMLGLGIKLLDSDLWWSESMLFGSILSSTDPVAVISVLKGMSCPAKLTAIFEGESLLNDGTSVILYQMMSIWARSSEAKPGAVFSKILYLTIGSPIFGVVVAMISSAACRLFSGLATIKSLWLIICNSAAFWFGDQILGVSGPLVSVVFGLSIKFWGFRSLDPRDLEIHHHLLQNFAVLSEMILFELSGAIAMLIMFKQSQASIASIFRDAGASFILMLIVRGVLLFGSRPVLVRLSPFYISRKETILLWFGGLRGAITLALTLMIQQEPGFNERFRNTVPLIIAATVVTNLVVQGQFFGILYRLVNPYPTTKWEINHVETKFNQLENNFEAGLFHHYNLGGLPLVSDCMENEYPETSTAVDLLINGLLPPMLNHYNDPLYSSNDMLRTRFNSATKIEDEFSYCLSNIRYGAALRQWLPIIRERFSKFDIKMSIMWKRMMEVLPKFEEFKITPKGLQFTKKENVSLIDLLDSWLDLLEDSFTGIYPWASNDYCEDGTNENSYGDRRAVILSGLETLEEGGTPVEVVSSERRSTSCVALSAFNYETPYRSISVETPSPGDVLHRAIYQNDVVLPSILEMSDGREFSHDVILNLMRLVSEEYVAKFQRGNLMQAAYRKLYDAAQTMVCAYEVPSSTKVKKRVDMQWYTLMDSMSLSNGFVHKVLLWNKKRPNTIFRAYLYKCCMTDLEAVINYIDTMEHTIFSSGSELITLIGDPTVSEAYTATIGAARDYLQKLDETYSETYHVCTYIWFCKLLVQEKLNFIHEKRRHGVLLDSMYRPMVANLERLGDELRGYKDFTRRSRPPH
eukprot:GHVH01005243.1.p1 GENE.GHVH01005243.1~~GHVH01005243.1.p1  ORF type:complete len:945 (-),score=110.55 GHVH01005243.1:467-3301(-)